MRTFLAPLIAVLTLPLLADAGANPPACLAVQEWTILKAVPIYYPPKAIRHRIEGEVSVFVTVDDNGLPTSVKLKTGNAILAAACVDALKQWHFEVPAIYGYKAPVSFIVKFQFDCKDISGQPNKNDLHSLGQRCASLDFIIDANAMRARAR